ncbi:MAG: GNAT family N-acetyltransferase [Chloroflexi bacterium]|nr:GNAT family N-acetyltransferase [Chloroflexota bacterium]MCC6894853.1 GNAT family N-acetyltransferase [Anaerolineae bacterium]
MVDITYHLNPTVTHADMNTLFAAAWEGHTDTDFTPVLSRSLAYIGAYDGAVLVGFVNVAWDGGVHAFLLDTTVHSAYQRRGIGVRLVQEAAAAAKARGIDWLHVDYEPHLDTFYRQCGFEPTLAGLMKLNG